MVSLRVMISMNIEELYFECSYGRSGKYSLIIEDFYVLNYNA